MVAAADDPLAPFHPIVRGWFERRFGTPTDVQRQAWPAIARGEHVLATAPTGSGKTLAAFLWALDRLLAGSWEGGRVRVLYVSPLKALNNDVERNLLAPLSELTAAWSGMLVFSGALLTEHYGMSTTATGVALAAVAVAYLLGNRRAGRGAAERARRTMLASSLVGAVTILLTWTFTPAVALTLLVMSSGCSMPGPP